MSNLLLDERPLIVLPSLAAMLNSLDEAVILQQIHYWIEKGKTIVKADTGSTTQWKTGCSSFLGLNQGPR